MTDRRVAGFLPVDKPAGPTSHDVVRVARRELREKRIGHTGTLDPFASGLLLIAVGWATRLAEYLAGLSKTYVATIRLGTATDTDDRTGSVIATSPAWAGLGADQIQAALDRQTGEIQQAPPAYSARKVAGERMYRAAREGRSVTARPATVTVESLCVTRMDLPEIDLEITCSTGTYIRAIARDVGADLGVYGHVSELRRTRIGPHHVDRAIGLDDLADELAVADAWIEPADAVAHLARIETDAESVQALLHGRAIVAGSDAPEGVTAATHGGRLVAVGNVVAGAFRPRKVFPS